jgi:hypothetical protein
MIPMCLAIRWRSSLNFLSSLISIVESPGQSRKRIDMRSSRVSVACRSCSRSNAPRFAGRFSMLYGAPMPWGTRSGFLPSPNHFLIFAAKLRMAFISHLVSAAPGAMARAVRAKREAWVMTC